MYNMHEHIFFVKIQLFADLLAVYIFAQLLKEVLKVTLKQMNTGINYYVELKETV